MKARLVVYGERHSARATTIKKPAGIAHCGFRVSKLIGFEKCLRPGAGEIRTRRA
jgi:hypothetical protein